MENGKHYIAKLPEIVAVFGPQFKDTTNRYFVRGVEVQRLHITQFNQRGQEYHLCRFPDGRDMFVNEGNIRAKRRPPQRLGGTIE